MNSAWRSLGYNQLTSLSAATRLYAATGSISGATNNTPVVITTSAAHNLQTDDYVTIVSMGGLTSLNGKAWKITRLTDTTFRVNGSVGDGAYTSGGTYYKLPAAVDAVLLQAETQNIRWRDDGTDPTASVGMLLVAGDSPTIWEGDYSVLRFIEATASAKLNVTFYRQMGEHA